MLVVRMTAGEMCSSAFSRITLPADRNFTQDGCVTTRACKREKNSTRSTSSTVYVIIPFSIHESPELMLVLIIQTLEGFLALKILKEMIIPNDLRHFWIHLTLIEKGIFQDSPSKN